IGDEESGPVSGWFEPDIDDEQARMGKQPPWDPRSQAGSLCRESHRHQGPVVDVVNLLTVFAPPGRFASLSRDLPSAQAGGKTLNVDLRPAGFRRVICYPSRIGRKDAAKYTRGHPRVRIRIARTIQRQN